MIQRIQTVYFFLAVIILIYFSAGASIVGYVGNDMSYTLYSTKLTAQTIGIDIAESSTKYYFIGSIILILWTLFVIISFRTLSKQLAYARIGSFMYLAYLLIVLLSFFIGSSLTENPTVAEHTASLKIGSYLLIVGYILYLLGMNGVKKDKNLIDSVDRIR